MTTLNASSLAKQCEEVADLRFPGPKNPVREETIHEAEDLTC